MGAVGVALALCLANGVDKVFVYRESGSTPPQHAAAGGIEEQHAAFRVGEAHEVGGGFEQLVYFFPTNKIKYVVPVRNQGGQAVVVYAVAVVFKRVDLHNAFAHLVKHFFVAQALDGRV